MATEKQQTGEQRKGKNASWEKSRQTRNGGRMHRDKMHSYQKSACGAETQWLSTSNGGGCHFCLECRRLVPHPSQPAPFLQNGAEPKKICYYGVSVHIRGRSRNGSRAVALPDLPKKYFRYKARPRERKNQVHVQAASLHYIKEN